MKFYYNGKLMRTSKNHDYKYAIIWDDETLGSCHSSLEAAQKEFRRPISEAESAIADDLRAIKALQNGKTYYDTKVCRRWYRVNLKGKDALGRSMNEVSYWENCIERHKRHIEKLKTRKIVELEARA